MSTIGLNNSRIEDPYNMSKDAIKAFNGRSITKKYKEGSRDNRFEAFEACINYRKDKDEEWYFGALGEIATMINNCIYLNAAHQITGLGFIIAGEWYHSCSEGSYSCSLYCSLICNQVKCCWGYKNSELRIVPFLSHKNFQELNKIE